jgi:hypothetical protein
VPGEGTVFDTKAAVLRSEVGQPTVTSVEVNTMGDISIGFVNSLILDFCCGFRQL